MGQAQTKAARLGWREGAQAREEHTVNSLGWAERHGNRAGVADSLAWREGGKVECRARARSGWGPLEGA